MQEYSVEADEAHALVRELRAQTAQAQADIAVLKNDVIHHQEAIKLAQNRHEQDEEEQVLKKSRLAKQNFMPDRCRKSSPKPNRLLQRQERILKLLKKLSSQKMKIPGRQMKICIGCIWNEANYSLPSVPQRKNQKRFSKKCRNSKNPLC